MINLLPSDLKKSLVFAHHNTKLVRVVIGLAIGIVGIMLVIAGGMLYLQQETNSYKNSNRDTEATLKAQNEAQTIARVQDISNSLKLVVDVLSQEILFSKLLRQVGAAMPPNTVLQDLKLSSELDGALDLQAGAKDYNAASQIQVNLEQQPDSIFSKADLLDVTCTQPEDGKPNPYPCKATLTATLGGDNNFMLLPAKKSGGTQ